VNAEHGESAFDPDLDELQPRRARPAGEPIAECQRLLANPLLAVLCWAGVYFVIRHGLLIRNLPLFLVGLVLLIVPIFLVQYHCLDCGATGWLFRSRRHACQAVVARLHNPGTWRRRGPRLKIQIIIWLYCLAAASILLVIGYLSR
jgi:hypothetical protein